MRANETLADNIRLYRKQAKLTQTKAAKMSGLSFTFWNHVENKRVSPSVATLERMCNVIEVSVSKIFEP